MKTFVIFDIRRDGPDRIICVIDAEDMNRVIDKLGGVNVYPEDGAVHSNVGYLFPGSASVTFEIDPSSLPLFKADDYVLRKARDRLAASFRLRICQVTSIRL